MKILKDKLDRRKWNKSEEFEASYHNNMVTKDVEAYEKDNLLVLVTYTNVSGFSIEIFDKPDRGMVQTKVYMGNIRSKGEFEDVVDEIIEEHNLN